MSDVVDLDEIRRRMEGLRLTQSDVARECGITQPHLSKVLSGKAKMVGKTHRALAAWLDRTAPGQFALSDAELQRAVDRLRAAAPHKRMQIMQLLEAVELVVRS